MDSSRSVPIPASPGTGKMVTSSTALYLVLAGLFVVFGWQTMGLLVNVYQGSEDYSHGFVVPLVSLFAAYEIRKKYHDESYQPFWPGLPVAIMGVGIVVIGLWYRYAVSPPGNGLGVQAITGFGLFVLLVGLCLSLGGPSFITRYLFPICFFAFAVPWPESLTNRITVPLRTIVSDISVAIIRTLGVPVFQEGNVLNLANATLGVADACSGIRSLWVMLATAAAFGYFLRCGLIRSLILFVLAFPLSVVFNIIRVVATGLMVAWFGPHFAQGTRHELTGAIVFFFGVVTLVAIGWLLARGRVQPPSASGPVPRDEAAGSTLPGPAKRYVFVAVLGLLLVLGTTAQVVVERHYVQTTHGVIQRKTFADFPVKIGDFVQSGKGSFETTQIDLLRPSDMLNKTYRSPNGNNLSIWSLYWEPYRGKKTTWSLGPHSPDGCYPASGWQRVKNIGPNVMSDIIPDRNLKFRVFSKDNKKIVLVYFLSNEPIGDIVTAKSLVDRLRQMVDSWDSKDLVLGAQYVVTVQATVTSSVNQTVQDVLLFLKQIAPVLPAFGV